MLFLFNADGVADTSSATIKGVISGVQVTEQHGLCQIWGCPLSLSRVTPGGFLVDDVHPADGACVSPLTLAPFIGITILSDTAERKVVLLSCWREGGEHLYGLSAMVGQRFVSDTTTVLQLLGRCSASVLPLLLRPSLLMGPVLRQT